MKVQSSQQRADSTAAPFQLWKKIKPFCLLLADPVHSWHLGLLQQGTKQSLKEINLLEGVNESPNCLSMQDLLEHYELPEGSFSVRVAINISNKPKLPVKRGWRVDTSPMICLIKAWFLLFLFMTFSKACVCLWARRKLPKIKSNQKEKTQKQFLEQMMFNSRNTSWLFFFF